MIRASRKENVIPSRCTVQVDCRVPPGMGADHVRGRVAELIGSEAETGYRLEFNDDIVGQGRPVTDRADWIVEPHGVLPGVQEPTTSPRTGG